MRFSYTALFQKSYRKLGHKGRARVDAALRRVAERPFHPFYPGLSVHKLLGVTGTPQKLGQPAPPVWEMHASDSILVTFQYDEEQIILRNCGQHDKVLRNP